MRAQRIYEYVHTSYDDRPGCLTVNLFRISDKEDAKAKVEGERNLSLVLPRPSGVDGLKNLALKLCACACLLSYNIPPLIVGRHGRLK